MSLLLLPTEIVTQIFEETIDQSHHQSNAVVAPVTRGGSRKESPHPLREPLSLRLVCGEFSNHTSRIAIQNLTTQDASFIAERASLRSSLQPRTGTSLRPTLEWILLNKIQNRFRDSTGPFAFIHDAAAFFANNTLTNLPTSDDYVKVACRAILSGHEPSGIISHLMNWTPGTLLGTAGPIFDSYRHRRVSGERWWEAEPSPHDFYGVVHLVLACGSDETADEVIGNAGDKTIQNSHPIFGPAMRIAIDMNRPRAVTALLEAGTDPNAHVFGSDGTNALLYAADIDREDITNHLLRTVPNIDVNARCPCGETTLLWAIRRGWKETIELLLENETIKVDVGTASGGVLNAAAVKDDYGTTKKILARPEFRPGPGRCHRALIWDAVRSRAENVLPVLLDHYGFDLNQPLHQHQTALTHAAGNGFVSMVRLLLSRPGVDPNYRPKPFSSASPLDEAVKNRRTDVVLTMLELDRSGVLRFRDRGLSIFDKAAQDGYLEILKPLIDHQMLVLRSRNDDALVFLLKHQSIMEILEEFTKTVEDRKRYQRYLGRLLLEAAHRGILPVVDKLIGYDDVDPNYAENGRIDDSPLLRAAKSQHLEVMESLLTKRRDIDVDRAGHIGTSLTIMARSEHSHIVSLLMRYPGIDINRAFDGSNVTKDMQPHFQFRYNKLDKMHQMPPFENRWNLRCAGDDNPLLAATRWGRLDIFEMLYEDPRIDPLVQDSFGRSVLWWALYGCHQKMVSKILSNPSACAAEAINAQDQAMWTPLHVAANQGNLRMVRQLLSVPYIDPNLAAGGWTPLHMAMAKESNALIDLLLGHPALDESLHQNSLIYFIYRSRNC